MDLSHSVAGTGRFRVNVFRQRGSVGAIFRAIPMRVPTLESLNLPDVVKQLTTLPRGLVLVTGPTGSGKSTTLAAMINEINHTRRTHIMTIEDPIEFLHRAHAGARSTSGRWGRTRRASSPPCATCCARTRT